jgi:DNA polymerase III subunit delta
VAVTSYDTLLSTLARQAQGGAFFFYGEESYLREQAVEQVVRAHVDSATADFNLDQLRGDELDAESLASVLQTPPMMATWRVVVVREVQGLPQKAREALESVVAALPPGLALVLSGVIPSASKARFYTTLQKHCLAIEFSAVDEVDAPGRMIEHARQVLHKDLEPEAARALVAALGTEMRMLAGELGKLVAYVGERDRITLDDVRAVTGTVPRYDRWAWFDLIGERKLGEALRQLPTLLSMGESGVGLIIGMTSQLLRVGLVCAGGSAALERELKPYQRWLARRIVPQARCWTLPEVDAALTELLRTDRLLKSASLNDRQVMEELLLRLGALGATHRSAA